MPRIARWDGEHWTAVYDGTFPFVVRSLVVWNDVLLASGDNINAWILAQWDGDTWTFLDTRDGSALHALTVFQDQPYACIAARLSVGWHYGVAKWNGTSWIAVGGKFNDTPSDLFEFDGELHACGSFYRIDNRDVSHVVRWDGADWQPVQGLRDVTPFVMTALNDELIIAGDYYAGGEATMLGVSKHSDDSWWPLSNGLAGVIYTFGQHKGSLFAGGLVRLAEGKPSGLIARWNGQRWERFGADMQGGAQYADPVVTALTSFRDELIAAGFFGFVGEQAVNNIARWDGRTWRPLGDGLGNAEDYDRVSSLIVVGDELIAGGYFHLDGKAVTAARWDGDSWSPLPLTPEIQALADLDGTLVAAVDIENNPTILALDGDEWAPLGDFAEAGVRTLAIDGDALLAGGHFGVARWDGAAWRSLGQVGTGVTALSRRANGDLLAADSMNPYLFRYLGGTDWEPVPEALDNLAWALTEYRGDLFVGGQFHRAGGKISAYWARRGCPFGVADLNCDGYVDFADIDPFVAAMTDRSSYEQQYPNCNWFNADCNFDAMVDASDIDGFVAELISE